MANSTAVAPRRDFHSRATDLRRRIPDPLLDPQCHGAGEGHWIGGERIADEGRVSFGNGDLRSLIRPEHFLLFSSTAMVLFTLLALWHALVVQDSTARRVQALTADRDTLKAGIQGGRQIERISLRLARAGWRSKDALAAYVFAKTVLPFVVGITAIMFFAFGGAAPLKPEVRYIWLLGRFVIGFFGTDMYVRNAGDHRMNNALPDARDLLAVCTEGGLGLDAAITRVSREMMAASPDLADELSLTAIELGFLPNRQTALQNLTRRTNMPRLRSLVNSLAQT